MSDEPDLSQRVVFVITEADIEAAVEADAFDELWRSLGTVARRRGLAAKQKPSPSGPEEPR